MNKELFDDPRTYPKIVLWWKAGAEESGLELHDRTLKEAYNMAVVFGYKPPVWYKPWQYLTGGLGVLTVGFGEIK